MVNDDGHVLQKLELNERNVFVTLKTYTTIDESSNVAAYSFMPSNPAAEELSFDLNKIDYTTVEYLMGQLKAAHEHKKVLSLADMAVDYQNRLWTQNKQLVYVLCYLGVVSAVIPEFKNYDGQILSSLAEDYKKTGIGRIFYPSYGPNDPRFDANHPFTGLKFDGFKPVD